MPRLSLLALILLAFSLTAPLQAQADNRYQVDLVVYANNDPGANQAESWPDNLHLRYPRDWRSLKAGGDGHLNTVSTQHPRFAKALRSLQLSSRYRILTQQSWIQDLKPRRNAPAILIRGGREYGEHYELEGYIRIALERYLYAQPMLWLSRFGERSGNYYLPRHPYRQPPEQDSGFIDESFENSAEYAEFLRQNPQLQDADPANSIPAGAEPVERIVVMDQERRMRSEELHYIDHPLFGLLIMISKPQSSAVADNGLGEQ